MTTATAASSRETRRRVWPALLHRVVATIRRRALLERGQHVLVAVSGGPDSVALLSLLHRLAASWKLTVTAAHFNYGLRGTESDGDESFVRSLCREMNVPLLTRRLAVTPRSRGLSVQAAARDLRYRALRELARDCGADRIALGHTADDQAETVLMWMLRGAGLAGLSGMPPFRDGTVIRPLYDATRRDIVAYLRHEDLRYREDSSNAKPLYLRNRLRHEVMPSLTRIAPAGPRTLCRLADLCREDDRYLDGQVAALCSAMVRQDVDGDRTVDRAAVLDLPLALRRRLMRELLRRCDPLGRGPSAAVIERALACLSRGRGATLDCRSARLTVTDESFRVGPAAGGIGSRVRPTDLEPKVLDVSSVVAWAGTGQRIQAGLLPESRLAEASARDDRSSIVVDVDRCSLPLTVRAWRPGDRFCPLGMKGRSKKLQDFFGDLKLPAERRRCVPLVVAPEGIVWVVGYRQDGRFAAQPSTRRRMVVSVMGQPEQQGGSG